MMSVIVELLPAQHPNEKQKEMKDLANWYPSTGTNCKNLAWFKAASAHYIPKSPKAYKNSQVEQTCFNGLSHVSLYRNTTTKCTSHLDTQAAPAKSHSSSCSTHRHENMQMNAASQDVSESTFTITIINYASVPSKLRSLYKSSLTMFLHFKFISSQHKYTIQTCF